MSNFKFGYDFIEPTVETPSSEDSGKPWSNAADYNRLRRHYRSLVQTEVTIVCNFGAAKALVGLFLNDVNFTAVTIQGNATDSWVTPSFTEDFTVAKNVLTQRYQIYCALAAFNYQYLRIKIPAQTPADGLSVFRVGTRVFILTQLELARNPSMGYARRAGYPAPIVNQFLSGGRELISQGDYKIWSGTFSFDNIEWEHEPDLWTLDAFQPDDPVVFYENLGTNSHAYLCRKDDPTEVSWPRHGVAKSSAVAFTEVI